MDPMCKQGGAKVITILEDALIFGNGFICHRDCGISEAERCKIHDNVIFLKNVE
jgi:hypothetical protein